MIKKGIIIILMIVISTNALSQSISVASFKLLESDLTANTAGTMETDQNGEVAALIKVVTTQTGFTFDGGALGVVKTKQTPGEIWVYIPKGAKKITIKHPQLGVLRDYFFPISIEAAKTYEMVLASGTVQTIVQQARTSQYVVFQLTPPNAIVELDGSLLQTVDGTASKMMKFGSYDYRVQAPNYIPEAGKVTVNDPENKHLVNVSLKPNFSRVTVKVDNNAEIWVNGEKKGNGTWTGDLGEGTYEFEAKKQGHRSTLTTRDIVVTPETQVISLQTPSPIYGEADINSTPAMADIYIDGEKRGQTPQMISKLIIGSHQVKISKKGYSDYSSTITIKDNETCTLSASLKKDEKTIVSKKTPTNTTTKGNSKFNYGYINSQEIIKAMPEFTKARTDIEALAKQYDADLKSMQEELQRKSEAFEKEQSYLSNDIRLRHQAELQDMYQKIQQVYQDNQQYLQKVQKEKMEAITSKVLESVKEIGNQYNLLYIFDISGGGMAINENLGGNYTSNVKYKLGIGGSNEARPISSKNNWIGYVDTSEILTLMNVTFYTDSIKRQQIIDKVIKAIKKVSIKNNFTFLLDKSGGIPFINTDLLCNATQCVKEELGLIKNANLFFPKVHGKVEYGYIYSQDVIKAMPEFTKARTDIEALAKQYDADLKSMQEEIQKKAESLEKEQANLPANIKQRRETELQEMYQKYQQIAQDNQQTLVKEQSERMQAITTKVLEAVNDVGLSGNYAFIMDMSGGIPFINTNSTSNVTRQVKTKLGL